VADWPWSGITSVAGETGVSGSPSAMSGGGEGICSGQESTA